MINVAQKNELDRITHVERMPGSVTSRKAGASAARSRFDKSRVIRGEPGVLLQRELETGTDLFFGIVEQTVMRFGRVVMGLVRKTLAT